MRIFSRVLTADRRIPDQQESRHESIQALPNALPSIGKVSDWAEEIRKVWTKGNAGTLELARVVAAAKEDLRYGQWKKIWGSLPFSRRKADMLAAVGQTFADLDGQTFARLPSGWSVLYQPAQLQPTTVGDLGARGRFTPGRVCATRKNWWQNTMAATESEPEEFNLGIESADLSRSLALALARR